MREGTSAVPDPGPDAAFYRGCTCPVIDNHHGRGYRGQSGIFMYSEGCAVHWPRATLRALEAKAEGE